MSPTPVATVIRVYVYIYIYIYIYIYMCVCVCVCVSLSFPNRVHREFMTLISFFLEGLILEGKLILLLKFLLLFRCVFEAIFKVKVNLGFHKLFCIK
jgi:hypothetical protein